MREAGDIMVQKAPACYIGDLALALKELFNANNDRARCPSKMIARAARRAGCGQT